MKFSKTWISGSNLYNKRYIYMYKKSAQCVRSCCVCTTRCGSNRTGTCTCVAKCVYRLCTRVWCVLWRVACTHNSIARRACLNTWPQYISIQLETWHTKYSHPRVFDYCSLCASIFGFVCIGTVCMATFVCICGSAALFICMSFLPVCTRIYIYILDTHAHICQRPS